MRSCFPRLARSFAPVIVCALGLVIAGCPVDPDPGTADTGRRDGGACVAVDVGPSAPDGDEPADTGPTDDAGDAGSDASFGDAASDAEAEADAGDESDAEAGDTGFETTPNGFDAGAPVPRSAMDAIINLSCTFTDCHGRAPQGVGGLFLPKPAVGDWYPSLVRVASVENPTMPYVDPGNPAGSWLVHKVVGDQCLFTAQCKDHDCGDQMPQANDPLDPDDMRTILDWVRQGAPRK